MIKKLKKSKDNSKEQDSAEMSFLDHLEELRWNIVRALIAIVAFAIIVYIFNDWVFNNIIFAHKNESFITYTIFQSIGVDFRPPNFAIIQTEMGEQFFTALKVSFWIGLVVAFPYVFYQLWSFIKPGLYEKEQKAARGVVFVCSFLFMTGVLFGFIILAPFAINFLAGYTVGLDVVNNSCSLRSYVGYLTMFTIPTGVLFQLPLLVYFLAKVGLITPEFMKNYRKHAFVIILVMAAVITPPDIITQFLIGVPVYFLYEMSILIAAKTAAKRQKELDAI